MVVFFCIFNFQPPSRPSLSSSREKVARDFQASGTQQITAQNPRPNWKCTRYVSWQPISLHRCNTDCHKLLYKTALVFPTPELQVNAIESSSYTLPPGQYEYPFSFRIPVNNSCSNIDSSTMSKSFKGLMLDFSNDMNKHTKKTLPPTLTGFPGLAEIRYYIKVTAVKPKFYQENLRVVCNLIWIVVFKADPS